MHSAPESFGGICATALVWDLCCFRRENTKCINTTLFSLIQSFFFFSSKKNKTHYATLIIMGKNIFLLTQLSLVLPVFCFAAFKVGWVHLGLFYGMVVWSHYVLSAGNWEGFVRESLVSAVCSTLPLMPGDVAAYLCVAYLVALLHSPITMVWYLAKVLPSIVVTVVLV